MGLFSRFENKAEDIIEGTGGRRGGIEPVKLAKRAFKEMEREKMIGVGHEYAPTLYNVLVSPEDDDSMSGYYPSLAGEIETYLTSRAGQSGLIFDCPPLVRFIVDEGLRRGKFDIIAESVSPAIISELRHEEMVHYGLEAPDSYRAPEPQPEPVNYAPVEPEPNYMPYADEDPYASAGPDAARNYPPTEAPLSGGAGASSAAQGADSAQTIMLGQAPATPAAPVAYLVDHDSVKRYPIRGERCVIGREKSCDVALPDPSVSRRHAEILHNESGWLVRDTGSTNGTSVNGTVETQSRIYEGDLIELGHTRLEFREA